MVVPSSESPARALLDRLDGPWMESTPEVMYMDDFTERHAEGNRRGSRPPLAARYMACPAGDRRTSNVDAPVVIFGDRNNCIEVRSVNK